MNSEKSFWEKYFQEQKKYKESKKHIMMVIAAIIREAGGVFRSKTILNKVIWKAHLIHWKENRGLLTNEKIVHLPKGPFLDNFDPIVGFLKEDGWVIENWVKPGSYKHKRVEYRVTEKADPNISSDRLSAIRKAIEWSRGQTANGISIAQREPKLEGSRGWQGAGCIP